MAIEQDQGGAKPDPSPSISADGGSSSPPHSIAQAALTASKPPARRSRRKWLIAAIAVGLIVGAYVLFPIIRTALRTVSTDDAYVNGHVTFVAARVAGQVTRVLVDDNNRVRKGELLVQLDTEPFQIRVDQLKASVALAKADLVTAQDDVRALVAQMRSNRFKLQNAIEQVNNQLALLRSKVAALGASRARLVRARADLVRAKEVQKTPGAISPQDLDQRDEAVRVSEAQATQALEEVYQIRASLGLPAKPPEGKPLEEAPPDLDQTFSTVRQALADLQHSSAALGFFPTSYNLTPTQVIEDFYKRDPHRDIDQIYKKLMSDAPQIRQAEAKLDLAQNNLRDAELDLRYCNVYSEIDGVVTRRNVNPGNNVQAGQSLMAVRSLTEIWIDANFKETQLSDLRIGQRVDLEVDMHGGSKTFPARITGFTMGTGSTLALLPAQNATGNFIKVVQRLPVRIEPVDYDPDKDPLFIGLSVVPYVYVYEPPTGPNAGQFLQPPSQANASPPVPAQRPAVQP